MKVGIDCVDVERIEKLFNKQNINNIFCEQELENINNCAHPYQRASGYFAVKEAVLKALEIGIYNGLKLNKICVEYNQNGAPILKQTPELLKYMQQQELTQAQISITHTNSQATAICIMQ